MDQQPLREAECPICLESLRKPIRLLSCGHNLCQVCLQGLCGSSSSARCPTCRKVTSIPSGNVENLPRNHTVENIMDRLSEILIHQAQSSSFQSRSQRTDYEIQQMKGLIASYKSESKYAESIQLINILLPQLNGCQKLYYLIDKALLCVKCGQFLKVQHSTNEVISVVNESLSDDVIQSEGFHDMCDEGLKQFSKLLLDRKDYNNVIRLSQWRFKFVRKFYKGENKLKKISDIGLLLQGVSDEIPQLEKIKSLLFSLEVMLEEMLTVKNVDLKTKTKHLAWFQTYYGVCCNKAREFSQSILVHKQAILLMKAVFTDEASQYRVFGNCHHNLAVTLEKNNQITEAKTALRRAIACYSKATDWSNEERKSKSCTSARLSLNRISS